MGRAALITLLYISFAWTLLISHQFFIGTAVATVVSYLNSVWPSVGGWLSSKIDILVFIDAFAWVFVLSSVLPSIILGKERAVITQFFVVLTLTFVAFVIGDALITVAGGSKDQMYGLGVIFHNPFLAALYLLIPYVFMLFLDVRSRRRQKAREERES